jgi:adenosylcobinamide-GDP ribazoletransferase
MLAVSLLVTGAFHEDGLADVCDGFGGGTTPERILAIMKDSRIGAFGAIGICMMLGLKWITLVALPSAAFPLLVAAAHMQSRWCALGLIWRLPYARGSGARQSDAHQSGAPGDIGSKSKSFAESLSAPEWIRSGVIGLLPLAALAYACSRFSGGFEPRLLGTAAAAAATTALLASAYFKRRIGGYTGDCLGAVQQVSELAFLLGGLAAVGTPRAAG